MNPPPFSHLPARAAVWPLDPATYQPHRFHRQDAGRVWLETNCYVDLFIEILHAAGVEPAAALAFTLAADFEGDQWTFFKFPLGDLQRLYGVDTQELSIWRAPHLHALEQVARGRIVMMEMDSFFLPDTKGTAYQNEHVKTTVGIQELDLEQRRMGYFHNAGYYAVEGDDFDRLFRLEDPWTPKSARLLPYTEFVKVDRVRKLPDVELAAIAAGLAREHLARRPAKNPFATYKPRFVADFAWLREQPPADFHAYAFVTIRQFGACYELAGDFCRFLAAHGRPALEPAAVELTEIANEARMLQLKLARAVTLKRTFEPEPVLDGLAARWDRALAVLDAELVKA